MTRQEQINQLKEWIAKFPNAENLKTILAWTEDDANYEN